MEGVSGCVSALWTRLSPLWYISITHVSQHEPPFKVSADARRTETATKLSPALVFDFACFGVCLKRGVCTDNSVQTVFTFKKIIFPYLAVF